MSAAAMHTYDLASDVLAAQRGDETAFSRLIEHYQNAAASVALAIVRNASASQDIAQKAFVAAWRQLRTLRQPESFGPWLLQLVRREALQVLRSDKRRLAREGRWQAEQPETGPNAGTLLGEREMYHNLYIALDDIPDECREILLLYYREGRSAEQVGQLLTVSAAAVRKRLERARHVLRDRFDAIEEAAKKTAPPAGFALLVLAAIHAAPAAAAVGGTFALKAVAGWTGVAAALVLIGSVVFSPRPNAPATDASRTVRAAQARTSLPFAGTPDATTPPVQTWASADDAAFSKPPLSALPSFGVGGQVLDAKGTPIAGAVVQFSVDEGTKRVVTNTEGEYTTTLPRGVYRPSVTTGEHSSARPRLFVSSDLSGIDFVLGDPARIDGIVRDENGMPLRAHIAISPHGHAGDWTFVEAGEDGTFSATGLAPGSYDLAATTDDRLESPYEGGITVLAGGSYFSEIRFQKAAKIAGRVVDAASAPLAGVIVQVGDGPTQITSESQEDGTIDLPRSLPVGKNRVSVFEKGDDSAIDLGRGFATTRVLWSEDVKNDGVKMEIVVPRTGDLQIEAVGMSPKYLHMHRLESNGGWTPSLSRVAPFDAERRVSVRVPAGLWHLIAADSFDAQHSDRPMPVKVHAGRSERLQLTSRPAVGHTVRVVDADGQPARGAIIVSNHQQWATDDAGVVADLTPTEYPFTGRAINWGRGAAFTIADENAGEVTVKLQHGVIVRGTVTGVDAHESIAVSFTGPTDQWFIERAPLRFMGSAFELDDVPAGELRIIARTESGATGEAKVLAAPGETATVQIELGTSAGLKGILLITNGPPPAPLPVLTLDGKSAMMVGGGERFVYKHMTAGKHTLHVHVYGELVAERTVDLAAGEILTLDPIELDASTFKKPRVFQAE